MVVWSAGRHRSMSNSSTSRYESENRRYQRTAQTMISGSKCRHLHSAGRGLIMEYTAAYQTRSLSFCNTAVFTVVSLPKSNAVQTLFRLCSRWNIRARHELWKISRDVPVKIKGFQQIGERTLFENLNPGIVRDESRPM